MSSQRTRSSLRLASMLALAICSLHLGTLGNFLRPPRAHDVGAAARKSKIGEADLQQGAVDPINAGIDELMSSIGRVQETVRLPGAVAAVLGFLSKSRGVRIPRGVPYVFREVSVHAVLGYLYFLAVAAHLIALFDPSTTFSSGLPAIWDLTKPIDMTLMRVILWSGWTLAVLGCLRLNPRETTTNLKPLNVYLVLLTNTLLCLAIDSTYTFPAEDGVTVDLWGGVGYAAYFSVFSVTTIWLAVLARAFMLSEEKGREQVYAMQPRWFAIVFNYVLLIVPVFLVAVTPLAAMFGIDKTSYTNWLLAHPDAKWAQANVELMTLHGNNFAIFMVTLTNRKSLSNFWATVIVALGVGWLGFAAFSLTYDMWPVIQEVGLGSITMNTVFGGALFLLSALAVADRMGVLQINGGDADSDSNTKVAVGAGGLGTD